MERATNTYESKEVREMTKLWIININFMGFDAAAISRPAVLCLSC
jgi:hypothetical protein